MPPPTSILRLLSKACSPAVGFGGALFFAALLSALFIGFCFISNVGLVDTGTLGGSNSGGYVLV